MSVFATVALTSCWSEGTTSSSSDATASRRETGAGAKVADSPTAAPRSRPSVILVVIDTLRRDHLSVYGYERPTSPFLERLATEATLFTRALSTSSWTKPSMMSLFTGLLPTEHGTEGENTRGSDELTLLTEIFADHGYETAAFSANPYVSRTFGFDQGFQVFELHATEAAGRPAEHYADAREVLTHARFWLDRRIDSPFFLYIHLMNVHGPYRAPDAYRQRFLEAPSTDFPFWSPLWVDIAHRGRIERRAEVTEEHLRDLRARYDGAIAYTDELLGTFVADLRVRGILEQSVLVITSDHGEELFDHGSFGHRQTLHPEQLEVPLLLRLPAADAGGMQIDSPVSIIDVAPTLLDVTGILTELPGGSFGRGHSLLPEIEGQRQSEAARLLMAELARPRGRDWMAQVWPYRVVAQGVPRELSLYRVDEDPSATTNLAAREPTLTSELARRAEAQKIEWERLAISGSEVRPTQDLRRQLNALGYLDESVKD